MRIAKNLKQRPTERREIIKFWLVLKYVKKQILKEMKSKQVIPKKQHRFEFI